MGILVAVLFLVGAFLFCALIASWFVEGSAAITIVAILLLVGIFAASGSKK